jgi:hypothetical protein
VGVLRALHEAYKDRSRFLFIQVSDAPHEAPAQLTAAYREAGLEEETRDNRPRRACLAAGVMGLPFPCLLDAGGEAEECYDAWPERLVVVGADGRVLHDAGRGLLGAWDFAAIEGCLRALPAPTPGRAQRSSPGAQGKGGV